LLKSYTQAAVNLAQSLKAFAKVLKAVEEKIMSNLDDNHAFRQLLPIFTALRRATSNLRGAVVDSADVTERVIHTMLPT
jgi:hypothetical protein